MNMLNERMTMETKITHSGTESIWNIHKDAIQLAIVDPETKGIILDINWQADNLIEQMKKVIELYESQKDI